MADRQDDDVVAELARAHAARMRTVQLVGAVVCLAAAAGFTIAGVIAMRSRGDLGGVGGKVLGAGLGFLVVAVMLARRAWRGGA